MKKSSFSILVLSVIALNACQPPPKPNDPLEVKVMALESDIEKQSYALGANVGEIVADKMNKQQKAGMNPDPLLVVQGFIAGMQRQSQLNNDQIRTLNRAVDTQIREKQKALKIKQAAENKAAGIAFLTSNSQRQGITETESGLQYEIIIEGNGNSPKATDTVKVHYRGTLLDGTEFDSSYARNKPASFPLTRVIKGWTEGVQLMKQGAKYKFYVPSELAYGSRTSGKIPGNSTLIFEVELLEIIDAKGSDK